MKTDFLKAEILNQKVVIVSIPIKSILNFLNLTEYEKEGCIDTVVTEDIVKNTRKNLFPSPNITINIVPNNTINKDNAEAIKTLIDVLISGEEIERYIEKAELLSGYNELTAMGKTFNSDSCLFATITFNLPRETKEFLFNNLNKGEDENTLLYRKKLLNLLDEDYFIIHDILKSLNEDDSSPIKGQISFTEKALYSMSSNSLIKIIRDSKILDITKRNPSTDIVIIDLLSAYKESYPDIFAKKKSPFFQTRDIKYCLALFPFLWDTAVIERMFLTKENIITMFEVIKTYDKDAINNFLTCATSESSLRCLARKHGKTLFSHYDKQRHPIMVNRGLI